MYKLHFDNFLINEHDDDDLSSSLTLCVFLYVLSSCVLSSLHAIMSYFTYCVFYVCLFWALVSGRLTLCVP